MVSTTTRADLTRDQLLEIARKRFAAAGFYGASIAKIASELGLTKQALIYHFKRKEDLYAEVLKSISDRLLRHVRLAMSRGDEPAEQLENIVLGLYHLGREHPDDRVLLMRELLDNRVRAQEAKTWYLTEFLNDFVALVRKVRGGDAVTPSAALCQAYQLLGSVEYFLASEATLRRIYGDDAYEAAVHDFPIELRDQVRRFAKP